MDICMSACLPAYCDYIIRNRMQIDMSAKHKMATRRECLQLGLRDKMSTRRTKSRFRTGHRDWNLLSDSTAAQHVSTGEAEGGRGGAQSGGAVAQAGG